jgi:hypothetical protein
MEVVDRLLGMTAGHPYATQELCYFLWQQTPFDGVATSDDLDAALAAVLRSENAHFAARWDEASGVQKLLLTALAREPGRPMTNAYRVRHSLPPVSAIQAALGALVERELVAREGSTYRIAEPFLDAWVREFDAR